MIEIKCRFNGQKSRYGDYYREFKVRTTEGESRNDILAYIKRGEITCRPEKDTWEKKLRDGGDEADMRYYFRGYYTLTQIGENEWLYTTVEPYAD